MLLNWLNFWLVYDLSDQLATLVMDSPLVLLLGCISRTHSKISAIAKEPVAQAAKQKPKLFLVFSLA